MNVSTNAALQPALHEVPIFRPAWSQPVPNVIAACSMRHGGISRAPYDTLNLSLHVGDDAWTVQENRRRFARAAGFALDRSACAGQVHGADVAILHESDAGRGAREPDPFLIADGLVTDAPGIALLVTVADCLPVYLATPDGRAVALAHAGWRGIAAGVLESTVAELCRTSGANPQSLAVAFGPSIGPCCFEVGDDVVARFAERFGRDEVVHRGPGRRCHIDLRAAARQALAKAGLEVRLANPPCTRCDSERFFSHRARDGAPSGRMMAVVMRGAH